MQQFISALLSFPIIGLDSEKKMLDAPGGEKQASARADSE